MANNTSNYQRTITTYNSQTNDTKTGTITYVPAATGHSNRTYGGDIKEFTAPSGTVTRTINSGSLTITCKMPSGKTITQTFDTGAYANRAIAMCVEGIKKELISIINSKIKSYESKHTSDKLALTTNKSDKRKDGASNAKDNKSSTQSETQNAADGQNATSGTDARNTGEDLTQHKIDEIISKAKIKKQEATRERIDAADLSGTYKQANRTHDLLNENDSRKSNTKECNKETTYVGLDKDENEWHTTYALPPFSIKDYMNDRVNFQKGLTTIQNDRGFFYFKLFFNFNTWHGLLGKCLLQETYGYEDVIVGNSALDYLISILGIHNKALARHKALTRFIKYLSFLSSKTPWFFKSVKGCGNAALNSYNFAELTKEKTIEIECTEDAVDLRLETLMSLYKYAAYDIINQREIIPENLRKFDIDVLVFNEPLRYYQTAFMNTDTRQAKGGAASFKYKNINSTKRQDWPTFKLYTFKNCEFQVNTMTDFNKDFTNENPFNAGGQTIKLTYQRCYESLYNEWDRLFVADGIFMDDSEFIDVQNQRLKTIANCMKNATTYGNRTIIDSAELLLQEAMASVNTKSILGNLYDDNSAFSSSSASKSSMTGLKQQWNQVKSIGKTLKNTWEEQKDNITKTYKDAVSIFKSLNTSKDDWNMNKSNALITEYNLALQEANKRNAEDTSAASSKALRTAQLQAKQSTIFKPNGVTEFVDDNKKNGANISINFGGENVNNDVKGGVNMDIDFDGDNVNTDAKTPANINIDFDGDNVNTNNKNGVKLDIDFDGDNVNTDTKTPANININFAGDNVNTDAKTPVKMHMNFAGDNVNSDAKTKKQYLQEVYDRMFHPFGETKYVDNSPKTKRKQNI